MRGKKLAPKKASPKKSSPKKKANPMPVAMMQDAKWQAEDDLRTLTRAAEIQADQKRLAQAQKAAKDQVAALTKVTGKGGKA